MLAVVVIFGVMSDSVTQRTDVFGFSMAIGAQPLEVFRLVIGLGMTLGLIGLVFGLIVAFGLSRLMCGTPAGRERCCRFSEAVASSED